MKVSVLQQYLRSLLDPLRASGASAKIVGDLDRSCQELEPFKEKELSDLADFLRRAKTYEEQGNWPASKVPTRSRKQKEAVDLQETANRLRSLVGNSDIQAELTAVEKLTLAQIRELLQMLGITGGTKKKLDGQEKIRLFLSGTSGQAQHYSGPSEEKLARIIETLKSLKAKADGPDAPFDEIEAELKSLESQLNAREAPAAAKALGVIRTLTTRTEALEAIRRKVLAVKLARESIAY
jgi:hypothetical protein